MSNAWSSFKKNTFLFPMLSEKGKLADKKNIKLGESG